MFNSFWRGHSSTNSQGLQWMSWEWLSTPKAFGYMGFKCFKAYNMAMVGKKAWKLVSTLDSLITWLLKAKYFSKGDYYVVVIGHNPNYVWRSIWSVKVVIRRGFQWSIGTGATIPVWDHPSLRNVDCIFPITDQHLEWPHISVSNLLITHQKQWNMELINEFFDNTTTGRNTPLLTSVLHDMPIWMFEKDGVYSVRSAYRDIMIIIWKLHRGIGILFWSNSFHRRWITFYGELVAIVCLQESGYKQKVFGVQIIVRCVTTRLKIILVFSACVVKVCSVGNTLAY